MGKKEEKTNVMRILEQKKIAYQPHSYEADPTLTGEQIASILGEMTAHVFKTLVTQGKSNQYYVFVIPVDCELDLKKAAAASGEKAIHMLKQKDLLPLTGYVHGGCSPIGMKKQFPTFLHESAKQISDIYVSGGRVGFQIELATEDLCKVSGAIFADLVS